MLKRLFRKIDLTRRAVGAASLRKQFFDEVSAMQPSLFIEVGAYDGTAALRARKLLPNARVVAFEANPRCHAHFSGAHDFKAAGVEYLHYAVANEPGTKTFKMLDDRNGISKKSSLLDRTSSRPAEPVEVPSISLDSFFAGHDGHVALWIDVEGACGDVLQGASNMLSKTAVAMVEVEDTAFWEGQWLAPQVIAHLAKYNLRPLARDYEYPEQYNIMFAVLDEEY